jgi:hypothetical protein
MQAGLTFHAPTEIDSIRLVNPGSEVRNIHLPDPAAFTDAVKVELRFDKPCNVWGPGLLATLSRKGAYAIFEVTRESGVPRWRINLNRSNNAVVDGFARGGFINERKKEFVEESVRAEQEQHIKAMEECMAESARAAKAWARKEWLAAQVEPYRETPYDLQSEAEDAEFVDLPPENRRIPQL